MSWWHSGKGVLVGSVQALAHSLILPGNYEEVDSSYLSLIVALMVG